MSSLVDLLKSVILARESIGIVLIVACSLALYANRGFVRDVRDDPSAFWRIVARVAAVSGGITLLWVGLLDDWGQLVAEPYRHSLKWEYQRVVYGAIDPAIRAVSVVLILVSLTALACLFARHIGGYLLQAGTLVLAVMVWMPMYIMGQRLNAMIIQGAESSTSLPEILGVGAFWIVRMGLATLVVATTLLTAMMAIALVATLVLDLLRLRVPRETHEADGFFSELGRRAEGREDIPLKTLWRPIRRPL